MRITQYGLKLDENMMGVLVKENSKNYPEINEQQLNSPDKIVKALCVAFHLDEMAEEYVYLIAMNTKCKPIGFFEISHGSSNLSIASGKSIYQRALLCGAVNIVVAHNHPSGDITPSSEDLKNAEALKKAGKLLDINFVDNLIIAGDEYLSFKEQGLI